MVVDLESQTLQRSNGEVILFEIDPARKHSLLLGWDDIEEAIAHLDVIEAWESAQDKRWPSVPVGAGLNALLDSPKREGQRGIS